MYKKVEGTSSTLNGTGGIDVFVYSLDRQTHVQTYVMPWQCNIESRFERLQIWSTDSLLLWLAKWNAVNNYSFVFRPWPISTEKPHSNPVFASFLHQSVRLATLKRADRPKNREIKHCRSHTNHCSDLCAIREKWSDEIPQISRDLAWQECE